MKKITIIISAILLVAFSFSYAQRQKIESSTKKATTGAAVKAAAQEESKPKADIIEGEVISLKGLVLGTDGKVSKEEAEKLAAKGDPIVFKTGGKVYFIFNENGTFAYDKLANFANRSKVGIIGKKQNNNGIYSIVASRIVSLD